MINHMEKVGSLPNFNLNRIIERKDRLRSVLSAFVGSKLNPKQVEELLTELVKVLPCSTDHTVLFAALTRFTLIPIDEKDVEFLSWRLAGDVANLRFTSQGLSLDYSTAAPGWCLTRCCEVQEAVIRDEFKYIVKLFCMAGSWAGREVEFTCSLNMAKVVASRIGFNRRKKERRMNSPHEFVGLRMHVFVVPDSLVEGHPPVITLYGVKPKYLKDNKLIIQGRHAPCVDKVADSCWACFRGQDACRLAVREKTWIEGCCPSCNQKKMMDPRHIVCYTCRRTILNNQLRQLYAQEQH